MKTLKRSPGRVAYWTATGIGILVLLAIVVSYCWEIEYSREHIVGRYSVPVDHDWYSVSGQDVPKIGSERGLMYVENTMTRIEIVDWGLSIEYGRFFYPSTSEEAWSYEDNGGSTITTKWLPFTGQGGYPRLRKNYPGKIPLFDLEFGPLRMLSESGFVDVWGKSPNTVRRHQPVSDSQVIVPLWAGLIFFTPFLVNLLRTGRRKRRRARSLCLECGYDMRATPWRCPECGTVPIS
jgi:hypothetical protein